MTAPLGAQWQNGRLQYWSNESPAISLSPPVMLWLMIVPTLQPNPPSEHPCAIAAGSGSWDLSSPLLRIWLTIAALDREMAAAIASFPYQTQQQVTDPVLLHLVDLLTAELRSPQGLSGLAIQSITRIVVTRMLMTRVL